ncbi:MAG TPA: amidase [Gammaproteobacteria bacterium]|nr:amidase [Gammaproteobacteria bacterium]
MRNVYARIEAINPTVNALVNLLDEREALALAAAADQVPIAERGPLHGLPMAPKDAVAVRGFPTTWGFKPFATRIEEQDSALAQRMRDAGALFIGHSNMPEFGLGSNTFNALFGSTLNPYDLGKTAGGSSGGAAVALATDMLPLADGSDMGGSLRNPASFCNVVGLRPSIGRTPMSRGFGWYGRLVTSGPMAKTVADTTLLFSILAGPDASDPLTLPESGEQFLDALVPAQLDNNHPIKVAVSEDLGTLPIDPEVRSVIQNTAKVFSDLGAEVVLDHPNLAGAMEVFQTQRAAGLRTLGRSLDFTLPRWRDDAKDTAIWNIERGFALTPDQLLDSELQRTKIYAEVAEFFQNYDVLALPAAQVPPFSIDQEWVTQIDGVDLDTYIDWMAVCCMITVTGLPTLSIPAGFSSDGLPIGVQLVGKPRGDLALLKIAHWFEQSTQFYTQQPRII